MNRCAARSGCRQCWVAALSPPCGFGRDFLRPRAPLGRLRRCSAAGSSGPAPMPARGSWLRPARHLPAASRWSRRRPSARGGWTPSWADASPPTAAWRSRPRCSWPPLSGPAASSSRWDERPGPWPCSTRSSSLAPGGSWRATRGRCSRRRHAARPRPLSPPGPCWAPAWRAWRPGAPRGAPLAGPRRRRSPGLPSQSAARPTEAALSALPELLRRSTKWQLITGLLRRGPERIFPRLTE